jgi:thiamine-phosphate diphosphorylase
MHVDPVPAASRVPRLHIVTDDAVLSRPDFREDAERILRSARAPVALHLRGHLTSGRAIHALAGSLLPVAEGSGCVLVLNDRVDVALAVGASRVHLGQRSFSVDVAERLLGSSAEIGVSTHDAEEDARAAAQGARWIFAGTIWATPSHSETSARGLAGLADSVSTAGNVPVLAIGGVTPGRLEEARRVGAWGGAVIRGVWTAADPVGAVNEYLEALERAPLVGGTSRS